jgi:hypothetical protein
MGLARNFIGVREKRVFREFFEFFNLADGIIKTPFGGNVFWQVGCRQKESGV